MAINNEPSITPRTVTGIFTNYIAKTLPLAFDESMSYYECLCALLKYLNETIVPDINNTNDGLAELQELYLQLQTYVNDYFDNLDVQEEINNKLDGLVSDGTLYRIINQEIFNDLNNKVLQNTLDIENNSEELENSVKQNQANSISMNMLTQEVRTAMTGGSTAVVGVDSIGDTNVQNKAISIFKLDDYLQSTYSISYGEIIDLGVRTSGYYQDNGSGVATLNGSGSENWAYYSVNLTKNKIYSFTGYNDNYLCGLLVVDSDNNIIYNSNPTHSSGVNKTSLIFKVNDTNLRALMSITTARYDSTTYQNYFQRYNSPILREINTITNSFKKIEPRLIHTIENHYADYRHDSDGSPIIYALSNTNIKVYEMIKGFKYHLIGYDYYNAVGIYILGLDNSILYQSTNSAVGGTITKRDYTFTANTNGYILLYVDPAFSSNPPSIEIIYDLLENNSSNESVSFNKWFVLGDSITEKNFWASDNYADYIKEELNISIENLGVSSAGYMNTQPTTNKNFRTEVNSIVGYNYNTDIITIFGSVNDLSHIDNELGELGDTTTNTFYGCVYTTLNNLLTNFPGSRVGLITATPIDYYPQNKERYNKMNIAIKETAEIFDIPVLDLTKDCNLRPWNTSFKNIFYTADGEGNTGQLNGTHPNSKGHWLIHSKIKEFIKTL